MFSNSPGLLVVSTPSRTPTPPLRNSQSVRAAPRALEIVLVHEHSVARSKGSVIDSHLPFFPIYQYHLVLPTILRYRQHPFISTSRPLQILLFDSGALCKLRISCPSTTPGYFAPSTALPLIFHPRSPLRLTSRLVESEVCTPGKYYGYDSA